MSLIVSIFDPMKSYLSALFTLMAGRTLFTSIDIAGFSLQCRASNRREACLDILGAIHQSCYVLSWHSRYFKSNLLMELLC